MRTLYLRIIIPVLIIISGCNNTITRDQPKAELVQIEYINPVADEIYPDPTVIKAGNGYFYMYATQNTTRDPIINIQVAQSEDMVNWKFIGDALPVKPEWASETQNFWAPHVLYDSVGDNYYMYYSAQVNGSEDKYLAAAVSDNPEGPFTDIGKPLVTGEGFVNIDPMAYDDPETGKKLLFWGSGFQPIRVQELSNDRISFLPGSSPENMVFPGKDKEYSILLEGAWIDHHNGYYYMYYSGDNCCGEKANYAVMVARSENATGPYVRLGEENGTMVSTILEKNDKWIAPGHNSIVRDDKGNKWIYYHAMEEGNRYYFSEDSSDKVDRRVLLMDPVEYIDTWPAINDGTPSVDSMPGPAIFIGNE